MNIHLIAFNCRYSHSCLALFYVRNELEKNIPSCSVSIEQFTINDPYYETLLRIAGLRTEALFFSVYIWNATYLCRLLADLHSILPDKVIVLGGPQASSLRETLSFKPTVIHQQMEGVGPDFYDDLQRGFLLRDYWASPVKTFSFPYKQEDFGSQLKNRNIYYESSRGCPFFCAYCLSSTSRGVLNKDLDLVKKELLEIMEHSPRMIRFVDRTFNADPARALEIWRFLQKSAQGSLCTFHFEIAPDLFNEEMFNFLEGIRDNFFQFEVGIQSTNRQTLQAVNRKIDLEGSFKNIKRLIGLGTIRLHIDLILGLPTETMATFAQSIRDVFALQPHYLQMGLLKVLPDTAIFQNRKNFGIIACLQPPYQVMSTKWLDYKKISRLYLLGECIEAFYNKKYFKTFFSYIITKEEDIFLFFNNLLTLCIKRDFFSLSKTQEIMNDILFSFIEVNNEKKTLREFLIFDWLLCGHRFIPDIFNEDINSYKNFIWHNSPEEILELYSKKERSLFFKKGVFFKFSSSLLSHCHLSKSENEGYVVFFTENNIFKKNKTKAVLIPTTTRDD